MVGSQVQRDVQTDFSHIGDSFLIGTVSLYAVPLIASYMYSKISFVESQVSFSVLGPFLPVLFWFG